MKFVDFFVIREEILTGLTGRGLGSWVKVSL